MNARQHTTGLALVSLTLLLSACGGDGGTVDPPPPVGTPVTSTADSGAGSLRDLLGNAKDGDTLRLTSGTITLAGPLKVSKSVTLDLGSGVIDAAGKGRALEIPSGVTVTIKGGTLKGGSGAPITVTSVGQQALSVATYGGVLLNEGTLTLDSTVITGGKANLGGGIANFKTGTLTIKGTSSVTGNAAETLPAEIKEDSGGGGGIYTRGKLTLSGGSVSMNTAPYAGGGVYGRAGSVITISGGKVDGNTTTYPITTTKDGLEGSAGGGIFSNGNVTVTGGSVSGNTASYFGAGVTVQSSVDAQNNLIRPQIAISGGTIENNRVTDDAAGGSGGGLWLSGDLTMTGGAVRGNSAPYGGGLTLFRDANITGGTFEGNTARTKTGGGDGGGILAYTPQGRPAPAAVTFGGAASVKNNTAGTSGGGISVSGSTVTMTGGTVSANKGGGILLYSKGSFKLSGGSIENNTTDNYGGGVQAYDSATLFQMTGGAVRGNTAGKNGGGLDLGMASGMISGGVVENNTAQNGSGGGLQLYAQANKTMSFEISGSAIIRGNKAKYGGGIQAGNKDPKALTLNIKGGSITGNQASETGGGMDIGSVLNMTGGEIKGNSAVRSGGGMVLGGEVNMTGGEISGNTVTGRGEGQGSGGGVQMYSNSKFTASGGSIKDNTAWYGGGVFIGSAYQTEPAGNFVLAGATVSGNKATDTNVGGGFFNDGALTITSGSVTGNTAPRNGGGVFNKKDATYAQPGGSVTGNNPDNVFNEQ